MWIDSENEYGSDGEDKTAVSMPPTKAKTTKSSSKLYKMNLQRWKTSTWSCSNKEKFDQPNRKHESPTRARDDGIKGYANGEQRAHQTVKAKDEKPRTSSPLLAGINTQLDLHPAHGSPGSLSNWHNAIRSLGRSGTYRLPIWYTASLPGVTEHEIAVIRALPSSAILIAAPNWLKWTNLESVATDVTMKINGSKLAVLLSTTDDHQPERAALDVLEADCDQQQQWCWKSVSVYSPSSFLSQKLWNKSLKSATNNK